MPFIDIARALFAYAPQSTDELAFEENDFLYVLEKGEDDWWKVKKKVDGDDDGPIGLVPRNYLEAVPPISSTRTLYDYTAQTEEELSFLADLSVEIFDKDDPDWFLVRVKGQSTSQEEWEYGFVPSNYLDDGEVESAAKLPSVLPAGRPESLDERRPLTPPMQEDEEPQEPISPSNAMSAYGRPEQHYSVRDPTLDSKFKTWQVEEIDSRKRRKRGTLGIGNSSIVWSCEADKTPVQTWPITSLIEYNTEKKHLFIELSSPPTPASFHFHAESRAIASQISDAIGEIAGATRATGLREVAAASGDPLPPLPETSALAQRHKREDSDDALLPIDDGVKRGVILYDFDAHDDDELAVRQDQIIEILDDSHEEWWKCKAGSREGVVPASYVDVIKTRPASKKDQNSAASALATAVTQQRQKPNTSPSLPLAPQEQSSQSLSKPDISKVRTWTDKSGTYRVEAQFLGLSDDKIQLHKLNGIKISVPKTKMSDADVQYVERLLGRESSPPPPKPPPDSEKPKPRRIEFDWFAFFLESGIDYNVCQRYALAFEKDQMDESILPEINTQTLRSLGVREGDILRIMKRLDEKFGRTSTRKKSVRFGRGEVVEDDDEGKDDLSNVVKITQPAERKESLFSSGPGGALRNNTTRRGRPTTGKQAPEEVDGTLLSTSTAEKEQEQPEMERHGVRPLRVPPSRLVNYPQKPQSSTQGFEDDAWAVKQQPPKLQSPTLSAPIVSSPVQAGPPPGSAIHELASISPPNVSRSLPSPLQPQNSDGIVQLSPQPTALPVVNRPSSVPPTQTAPQMAPLQPHYTGIPPQQPYNGPTPAQASGTPSLNEQLAKLQLYRQQQMIQPQPTGFVPQYQPGYTNGLQPTIQQPTGMPLQPQPTGFMPNFLPAGQQNSQLGPTRSFSMGLPPPLIPTNTLSSQQSFMATHRTGPANIAPTPSQFQQSFQPQPTGFQQPQPTGFQQQPQPTGFQPQQPLPTGFQPPQKVFQQTTFQPSFLPPPTSTLLPQQPLPTGFQPPQKVFQQTTFEPLFLPPPTSTLLPQQTGFQQQMLPSQKTGAPATFKPVSFGTTPKPPVPSRTGKRANLAAASIPRLVSRLMSVAPENPFGF